MAKEYLYTVNVTLHIHAEDEADMDRKLHLLWKLYPDVLVADWEPVEKYDVENDRVIEWEER